MLEPWGLKNKQEITKVEIQYMEREGENESSEAAMKKSWGKKCEGEGWTVK